MFALEEGLLSTKIGKFAQNPEELNGNEGRHLYPLRSSLRFILRRRYVAMMRLLFCGMVVYRLDFRVLSEVLRLCIWLFQHPPSYGVLSQIF